MYRRLIMQTALGIALALGATVLAVLYFGTPMSMPEGNCGFVTCPEDTR